MTRKERRLFPILPSHCREHIRIYIIREGLQQGLWERWILGPPDGVGEAHGDGHRALGGQPDIVCRVAITEGRGELELAIDWSGWPSFAFLHPFLYPSVIRSSRFE